MLLFQHCSGNNRKVQLTEKDGDLHIVIKNPYLNNTPSSSGAVKAGENVICEEINKLNLSSVKCDKCHQNLDLKTKLQLEKLLNSSEDTDFKFDITKRLDKIEQLLSKILNLRSAPRAPIAVRVNLPRNSKPKKEYIEPEPEQEDQYEEEHLVEESEEFGYEDYEDKPIKNIKEVLANVNKRFPITSTQAMVDLNQDLISDSACLEEVVRFQYYVPQTPFHNGFMYFQVAYFRYLDHRISPTIPENTKILRKIVDDNTLKCYNWSGVSGKVNWKWFSSQMLNLCLF